MSVSVSGQGGSLRILAAARRSLVLGLALAFALGGCGGGNGGGAIPGTGTMQAGSSRARAGRLVLHIRIPKKTRHHHHQSHYVSSSTQSITIDLSGPTPFATTAPLTPKAKGCSSGSGGTSCTVAIPGLTPGTYTGSFSTWDTAKGTGNELSANQSVSFKIATGQANSIGIVLGGIPASVRLVPAADSSLTGSMASGYTLSKCGSDTISVYGVDADQNLILGAGAPVPSLSSDAPSALAVSTPPPSSPNAFTIVRPSPPPAAGSTVHLTAKVTPVSDSGASSVSTSPISMTFNHDICGAVTSFLDNNSIASYPDLEGITAGPDGRLWFAEDNSSSQGSVVGAVTTSGTFTEYILTSNGAYHASAVVSASGSLWFSEFGFGGIANVTTGGVPTQYTSGLAMNSSLVGITAGPDGNLWFTDCDFNGNKIGKMTTGGTITEYSSGLTSTAIPTSITSGPDGNLWFTEYAAGKIGSITTSGVITEYSSGIDSGASPSRIVAGPDGNLWFTEYGASKIGRITTSGMVNEYSTGISNAADPIGITVGPDGNLWFAESGTGKIGRITTAGTVTEFSLGKDPQTGSTATPYGIAAGPDGNLWLTEGGYGPTLPVIYRVR